MLASDADIKDTGTNTTVEDKDRETEYIEATTNETTLKQTTAPELQTTPEITTILQETSVYTYQKLDDILSSMKAEIETACKNIESSGEKLLEKIGDNHVTYTQNKIAVDDFYEKSYSMAEELYSEFNKVSYEYYNTVAEDELNDYDDWDDALDFIQVFWRKDLML